MDKFTTRNTATPRTHRRSLTQSCDSVAERIQAVQDDAKARLDEAGDLRSAMKSRIGRLSEAMTWLAVDRPCGQRPVAVPGSRPLRVEPFNLRYRAHQDECIEP